MKHFHMMRIHGEVWEDHRTIQKVNCSSIDVPMQFILPVRLKLDDPSSKIKTLPWSDNSVSVSCSFEF